MERKFNENGILTGVVDSFCLTCKKHFKLNQASEHINEPDHQKTFQSSNYVEKFKEDSIRKVDAGYYCEMCNVITPNLARVGIHIYEMTHVNNKNKRQLKESDDGVVVFDDVLIEDKAWNGMADGSCLLCNIDYSNEADHKNEQTHMLKLIQSKFDLLKDKFVYRKIDDDSINCLICNTILMEKSKETHTNETEHKKNYAKCQIIKESQIKTSNFNNNNDDKNLKENVISTEIKNNSVKTEEPAINTSETQIVVFNKNSESENISEDELLTPVEAIKKAMKFAKNNGLKYKRQGTYCNLCDVKISSTLKQMREHVCESSHKEKKAGNNKTSKINKVPQEVFINIFTTFHERFTNNVVINDKICLEKESFFTISENNGVPRCLACQTTLSLGELIEHIPSVKHLKAMEMMNVITDFESEYVREVRPRVFHCGYCNFIETNLDSLKNHLKSIGHLKKKRMAEIRLQDCLLVMEEDRRKRQFINFMKMLTFFQ